MNIKESPRVDVFEFWKATSKCLKNAIYCDFYTRSNASLYTNVVFFSFDNRRAPFKLFEVLFFHQTFF